jgi:hypothetical protein
MDIKRLQRVDDDGLEKIGPKLVVEAGSHLYFIEFLERANRAAATESDDQVVELSNPREKILQLHGIACVYRMPGWLDRRWRPQRP